MGQSLMQRIHQQLIVDYDIGTADVADQVYRIYLTALGGDATASQRLRDLAPERQVFHPDAQPLMAQYVDLVGSAIQSQ
jgi:hypothetical protein